MTSKLYIGTIDDAGHVTPRPAVATPDGRWHYLDGHEPHTTICTNSLLHI